MMSMSNMIMGSNSMATVRNPTVLTEFSMAPGGIGIRFSRGRTLRNKWGSQRSGKPAGRSRKAATSHVDTAEYLWKGTDEFSDLDDRKDLPPLPLPRVAKPVRAVLVRHGQSTWNAEGRIQGSTDFAVLTPKGISQAETTHEMLEYNNFDALFHSPLARASQTAKIVWGKREGPTHVFPVLREVDLYSFQGLLKEEGIAKYGEQFQAWQKTSAEFEIDGHAPVRELWYRGSLAWQDVLKASEAGDYTTLLVVAHNAVNQAMIASALDLPPTYFRRILQSNGATSVLDLSPNGRVTVDRLNQSPGSPLLTSAGRKAAARIVLVRHSHTYSSEDGLMLGVQDEPCSPLGEVHAQKVGELIMDSEVGALFCSPLTRSKKTAAAIAQHQEFMDRKGLKVEVLDELTPPDAGEYTGMRLRDIRDQGGMSTGATQIDVAWERTARAWELLRQAADENGGQTVVAVAHASVISAMLCRCLDLPQSKISMFRIDTSGVCVLDFPDGAVTGVGNIRACNYTAHLGRWSVPITPEDMEAVCGIDGCF